MKTDMAEPPTVTQDTSAPVQTGTEANNSTAVTAQASRHACETVLLDDVPNPTDDFSNQEKNLFGPHQVVAEVIADMVQASEPRGISIGLEGSWGSGKTTVVKLLEKTLKDVPDIKLIQFDAWAHEGDTLRRTFLERMIKQLQGTWVDEKKWETELKKIANRKDVVVTKELPKVSKSGKAIGLSLLFVPLGGAFFGQALREPFTLTNTGVIAWRFVVFFIFGLLCSFAPLFILILKKDPDDDDIMGVLITKGATEKRIETDKTPNATSIEFEKYFRNLMGDALNGNSRRLILVLDNLDRVDSKEALSIWSTLQTFMQHKQDDNSLWYNRLWTLVLYDPKALTLLWQEKDKGSERTPPLQQDVKAVATTTEQPGTEEQPETEKTQQEQSPPPKAEIQNGSSAIATSFIDKSFQIRFEVSPPVPSNWRTFLLKRLAAAFPGHLDDHSQFHAIYRVLSIDRVMTKQSSPTIRELKLYVNQIGALHRQLVLRGKCSGTGTSSFPLSLLAYYVLLRRRRPNVDVADGVLREELPEKEFEGLMGEQVGDKLAALHYNVEISLARQIILEPSIKAALQDSKKEELISYAGNPDAFWQALGEIFDKEWLATESLSISKAATCLDDQNLLRSANQGLTKPAIDKLRTVALKVTSWLPLDDVRVNGITSLFSIIGEKEFAVSLLDKLVADIVAEGYADTVLDISIRGWVEKLQPVLTKAAEVGGPELYEQRVVERLSEKLRSSEKIPDAQLNRLMETLFELGRADINRARPGKTAAQALRQLIIEGAITRQLNYIPRSANYTNAFAMFLLIREDPKTAQPRFLNVSQANEAEDLHAIENFKGMASEFFASFTNILAYYDEWDMLFKMLEADPAYHPAVMSILEHASSGRYENFKVDPTLFLNNWPLLQRELDQGNNPPTAFERLIIVLLKKTSLADMLIGQGFQPKLAKLYGKIVRAGEKNSDFNKWLVRELQSLKQEVWDSQFWGEGELLELVNNLSIAGVKFDNGSAYEEALVKFAEIILTGRQPRQTWDNLAGILNEESSRQRFRNTLSQVLATHAMTAYIEEFPPVFFDLFGNELIEAKFDKPSIVALERLLLILIRKQAISGLRWAAAILEAQPKPYVASKSEGTKIKSLLLHVLRETRNVNVAEVLARIATALQLFSSDDIARIYHQLLGSYVQTESYKSKPNLINLLHSGLYFSLLPDGTPEVDKISRELNAISLLEPLENESGIHPDKIKQVLEEYAKKEEELQWPKWPGKPS